MAITKPGNRQRFCNLGRQINQVETDKTITTVTTDFTVLHRIIYHFMKTAIFLIAENPNLSEETVKKVNEVLEAIKNGEIEVKEEL